MTTYRESARQDLDGHAAYLTLHAGEAVADRFLIAARQTINRLAGMPGIGSPYPLTNPALQDVRHFSVRGFPNHVIFYREAEVGIEVLRVLHAARDVSGILEREGS